MAPLSGAAPCGGMTRVRFKGSSRSRETSQPKRLPCNLVRAQDRGGAGAVKARGGGGGVGVQAAAAAVGEAAAKAAAIMAERSAGR